jgi:hypothetical protein
MAKKKDGKAFESKFDGSKLRGLIQDGKSASEIMAEFDIKSLQSLRQWVLRLINEDRQFYEVPGLYTRNLKRPQINFKGELRLTANMLSFQDSTYAHGDQFEIDIDNEQITLRRLTNLPESTEEIPDATQDLEEL